MSASNRNSQYHHTYYTGTKSSGGSSRQLDTQGLDALAAAAALQPRARSGAGQSLGYQSSAHCGRTNMHYTDPKQPSRSEASWWMEEPPTVSGSDSCRESPGSQQSCVPPTKSDAPSVAPGKRRPSTNKALGHLRQNGGQGTTQSHASPDPHWTIPDEPGSDDEWWVNWSKNLESTP